MKLVSVLCMRSQNLLFLTGRLYQELFEEPFLAASGEHFKLDAAKLLQERDVSLYMERVIAKIEEELFRARKFLHASSLPKVIDIPLI